MFVPFKNEKASAAWPRQQDAGAGAADAVVRIGSRLRWHDLLIHFGIAVDPCP
jgi:hypothetical protein